MRWDACATGSLFRFGRRQFLEIAALGIGAAIFSTPIDAQLANSRVVQTTHPSVWKEEHLDATDVRQMLDTALQQLAGKGDTTEAWQSIVLPEDIIGIKVSMEADARLGTHRELVESIISGLVEAGTPRSQILIWDRMETDLLHLGYPIQLDPTDLRCYATDGRGPGYDPRVFYDTAEDLEARRGEEGTRSHFSKIVTQDVTRIINVATLKQHVATGVALCLKNLAYGSVNNTARFNGNPVNGNPAIAEIYAHDALKGKPILHLIDGLRGCFDRGPQFTPEGTWNANTLLAAFDPVALDYTAFQLIEDKRKEAGLSSLQSKARHINTAARMKLGTNTPDEIDVREITLEEK